MQDASSPAIVTDATAPQFLGMSPRAFREAVYRQRIPFRRLGRRVIVRLADLAPLERVMLHDVERAELAHEVPATSADMLRALGFEPTG